MAGGVYSGALSLKDLVQLEKKVLEEESFALVSFKVKRI